MVPVVYSVGYLAKFKMSNSNALLRVTRLFWPRPNRRAQKNNNTDLNTFPHCSSCANSFYYKSSQKTSKSNSNSQIFLKNLLTIQKLCLEFVYMFIKIKYNTGQVGQLHKYRSKMRVDVRNWSLWTYIYLNKIGNLFSIVGMPSKRNLEEDDSFSARSES